MSDCQEVYFDEAGFTGNHLLEDTQPYFSYAAVAVSGAEAESFINEIRKTYKIQSDEIKFSKVQGYREEKRDNIINEALDFFKDRSVSVCFDKKYSLCGKFVEYMIEPIIQDFNSFFYFCGCHHFLSKFLYDNAPDILLKRFEDVMRNQNKEKEVKFFLDDLRLNKFNYNNDALKDVYDFILDNENSIEEEFKSISSTEEINQYILDLSATSLFTACSAINEKFPKIKPIYDSSKPVVFSAMSNKRSICFTAVSGKNKQSRGSSPLYGRFSFSRRQALTTG